MKIRRYSAMPLPILAGSTFACTITSPAAAATVTEAVPVTITGTLTASAVTVIVKLGATVLGSASIVGLNWSYSWTPVSGDVGARTINATATAPTGAAVDAPGVGVTVASAVGTFATIFGANAKQWCRTDVVTTVSGAVSQWTDQTANAAHYTQATAGFRPTFNATGGPNSRPCITFDNVDDGLDSVLVRPAPGTTPTFRWAVARFNTWNGFAVLYGSSDGAAPAFRALMFPNSGTNVCQGNGANANAINGVAAGTWFRHEMRFANATTDWNKMGATRVTGENAGNNAMPAGNVMSIGKTAVGGVCGLSICEIGYADISPSAQQLIDLDAYCNSYYLPGLT